MFPDNQNNPNPNPDLNQNNNFVGPESNQSPQFQQSSQPQPSQFQQPADQLPPVQPQQPQQQPQPSSFNPMQQMGYHEPQPIKKSPNALFITIVIIILLVIGVAVSMVLISGSSKAPTINVEDVKDSMATADQQAGGDQDEADPNVPQALDTTPVVKDFYDNYLSALRANSNPKERLNVLHGYVKNNQDLTPSYQKQLAKVKSVNQDPLLFGQKVPPARISYGDPVAKKNDPKTVTLPVTARFGIKDQIIRVTLKWQTSQAQAGYWQISNAAKQ